MTPPRIYGLLGYPIRHSLSPAMHNAAFRHLGINAEYKLFEVKPEEMDKFLLSMKSRNIWGINVTIPYKEKVLKYLDHLSEEAELIGAVNTVRALGDRWEGFNTDGEGFIRHLGEDLGFDAQGKRIAVMGAGGASRAITIYLCRMKAKSLSIFDIDPSKTTALYLHLKEKFPSVALKPCDLVEELGIKDCDLLVNATPVGMKESDAMMIKEASLHKDLLAYDLIYNPSETKFLRIAREKGLRASNGLGMLLYQGMSAFKVWTGKDAPKDAMHKALIEALGQKEH